MNTSSTLSITKLSDIKILVEGYVKMGPSISTLRQLKSAKFSQPPFVERY